MPDALAASIQLPTEPAAGVQAPDALAASTHISGVGGSGSHFSTARAANASEDANVEALSLILTQLAAVAEVAAVATCIS
mgnify:CR=1 FL=1|jgi:hypothetical protein|tara:strand:+ start:5378 stop:5617 length:240 start_codon:yes stop_codon:yes gene_type:complete